MKKNKLLSPVFLRITNFYSTVWRQILFLLITLTISFNSFSQACDASTPSFTADLTGNPDSIWISPLTFRVGNSCCGNGNPDRCVEFYVTLDPGAEGINFKVASGAMPNGALFYQVDCSPPVSVGTPLCVSGVGPFRITFCKPGNNENTYSITSIAKPSVNASVTVSDGCTSTISTSGFQPATITWQSIAPGAPGQYNGFLSCTSGCASTVATYVTGAPASVTYQVCGTPIGGCSGAAVCKTTTVNFVSTLGVTISPLNPTICFGGTSTPLTANPTGGAPPYIYSWSNGASTQVEDASAPGTYTVSVRDNTSCPAASASVTVTAYSLPILANAGADKESCANNSSVVLSGSVQSATGGIWSGGAGTYSPSNTSLTPTYTPTATEILNGTVTHTLTTTGNGTCPSDDDQVTLTIKPTPIVNAGADQAVCGNNASVTLSGTVTNAGGGRWSGGGGTYFPNDSTLNAIYTPSALEISSGTATLTLTSIQNGTCTPVTDQMTISITPAPTVNAGADQAVCSNNANVVLNGSVTNSPDAVSWSLGAGGFNPNSSTLNATYTPTAGEITTGNVTLRLTATKNLCSPVTDDVFITFNPAPTVNAGPDRTVCANNGNVTLNGSVTVATGGQWTTTGSGSFNPNATTLNATYVPSAADTLAGSVTLTLTSTGNGLCNAVADQMVVTYTDAPTVFANVDQTVCGNKPNVVLNGSFTAPATGITWSGGTGVFSPNANTKNATYTPSATEIANGFANLTITTTGAALCSSVSDQMTITITPAPTVNAGPDQTVCGNNRNVTLAGSKTVATGGLWTTSGSGSFNPDATTLNAVYVPSNADTLAGSVTLTLTTTGNGLCNAVSDQMIITITDAPSVNAGSDQTICANNATLTLNGSVRVATGGTWTGGAGTFTPDANTLNATYKPTATEISTGTVNLTLTTTGMGTCGAVSDQMKITVTPPPTVNAGPDQNPCSNNPSVTLSGAVTVATGGSWSVGGGTFAPNNTTLNTTYIPSQAEVNSGIINLILTSTGNGNCLPVTDTVLIVMAPAPIVNAGADKTVCANNPVVSLSGTASAASATSWSGGSGAYNPTSTSLTPTYTPTATEINTGTVTLTLTGTRAGCNPVTDNMTITITPAPTVNAGPDQTVCGNNATTLLNGSKTVSTGAQWTTSGTGTFNPNATTLNASYVPTSADTSAGSVTLTLTTTGNGTCLAVQDQMVITITDAPIVNAGSDQTVCGNKATINLNGSVFVSTGATWSSGGTGSFSPNTNTLNASYTPSSADTTAGSVTLTLTSTGNGNCTPVSDQMVVTITDAPIVNAGADISICANNPVATLSGSKTVATGVIWTGGSGIFNPNNTTLNATYTPTATEINTGTVTLTLTTTGNGLCNQVSDQVVITITPAPTVNAGADQGVCGNVASVPLSGTITVAAGGTWTTSGTGSFNPNANTLNASYVPSAADIASTSVTLTLTTTGNGKCTAVNDQMVMTFSAVPFADAGPDQTVCTNDFPVKLNGNGTTSSWVGGAGTFTPSRNVLNPTYTPTAGEVTTGSVVLTLQTTPIGACPSVSDNITLTLPQGPVVSAGADVVVCGDVNSIALSGSVSNAGGGQWTTSGTGSFNPDATTLNASYVPSATDKTNGGVTLALTSTGNGSCTAMSDTISITITPAPTVNAGLDQTVCANNNVVTLNGSITVATGAQWTSTGSGTFSPNNTTLNATYSPSAADTTAGSVTLTLTTTGNGTCIPVQDQIIITITPAPFVNAGPDQTICADKASTSLSGGITVATGGLWTTSGTGSFSPNDVTLNTSYFPSAADTAAKSVRLILSSTGNGICLAVTDTMFITIDPAPVVNAGPDQTLCADIALISLSGGVTNAAGGAWTTSGSGTFSPDATTLNASYDPSTADSLGNVVTLTLTSTGNGLCNAVSDQAIITLTPAPTIDAGPDRIVCGDNPSLSVTANVTIAAGVLWTSSGTGTFTNPNNLTTTYNGTNADTTAGSVILRVISTGNGTCNPVKDSLTVTIADMPIVNAGTDQTVCGDIASVVLNGTVLHATGGDWSGGSGTFSPNASTLNATYIPSAAERVGTTVTLTLSSTGNGTCNPVTDQLAITITPIPTINAGPDQTVCADIGNVSLNGTVTIATGGTWTSSGTGTFADANSLITTYTPSATDTLNGLVTLTLTSTGNGTCNAVSDQMIINITPAPTVSAGPDKTICADQSNIVLNGSVTVATGGTWSSLGSGTFTPSSTALNGNYFTSAADTAARSIVLVLTTTGNGTCNAVKDTMVLTINPAPIVTAGPDQTICADASSISLNGAGITNAAGGQWTSTGTGSFSPNAFTINATYVPSAFDKSAGNITLTLISTGNGLCNAVSDQMTLTITPAPTVNAGPDQTVCATTAGIQLNGTITVATGGTWTTASGQGTFNPDANTLNAVFVPSANQINAGVAILRLTTTGNGTCNAVSDDIRITITPAPVVDAGPNQTVCASVTNVAITGTVSNATGGTWTTSGTGTFANANALSTTYTPSAFDKTAGNITLTLSSTGSGVCSAVTDIVVIGFQAIPAIDAGPATACATMAGIQLNGVATNASGGKWTSTGSGTFTASPNILNPKYTPSAADQIAGSIILYLTATGTGPCTAPKDSIMLGVQPNPTANAGPDQIVCADIGSITLNGSVTNAGGGGWTSTGGGVFSPDTATLNASYTLSAIDIVNKTVTLTLTTTGNGFCNATSDQMVVTITTAPTVNAGVDQTICADASGVNLNGAVTIATGGTWTSSGTGSFNPNATTLSTIYVPSAADTTAGSVRLKLTTTGNGTCKAKADSMDITITPAPTVYAGSDQTICADVDLYAFSASTTVATGVTWSTLGSGSFDNVNAIPSVYTISSTDKLNGLVQVIATTTGNGTCNPVKDTVNITITPAPTVVASAANACADADTIQLSGVITVASGGQWTTSGTGTFVPDDITLNARYVPSAADKAGQFVRLILTSTGNGTCGEVADTVDLNIVPSPTADAGPDQSVCANVTVPLNGVITNAGGGLWTTSGTGSFNPSNTTLNATYVPSTADTTAGNVQLVLTTTGNGFCNAVTDTIDVSFTPAPVVNAGPAIICVSAGSVNLNGIMANAGGIQWTSSGDGTFGDDLALSTTYTLGANDVINGTATLTLTTTGNGICAAASDNIILNIANAPTADANSDQSICGDASVVALSGSFTNAGSTEWSTPDGAGTFDDYQATATNYNVTAADTTRGFVTFVLTTVNNGICLAVTDTMVATITDAPSVDAGPANVCSNAPPVNLSGSMTVATGAIWTTAGDGTFSDPNTLSTSYTPGAGDNSSGSVILRLTTNAGLGTCNPVFDEITLNITDAPQALANSDQVICADASGAVLNGSVVGATGGIWTTSGSGSFNPDSATLNATYVPSNADTTSHSVKLVLTTTGVGSCNPVTDTMTLTINPVPIINAGSDQTVCGDIAAINLNGSALHATGGNWTTLDGTGTLNTPGNLITTYNPTSADTTRGSVTFVLTSTGMGTCNAVTDTMTVTITDAPSVDAGPAFICSDAVSIPLSGTETVSSGVNWTTTGDGSFLPNNISLNTNYVPSANDRIAGSVTLTITTTGNGTCNPVSDNIIIYLRPAPTVDAGGDQGICADAGVVTLTGSVTDAGGGLWTTLGTGTFAPDNALNTVYNLSNADTASHVVKLVLTTTGTAPCTPVSDTVEIDITPAPVALVNAGNDTTVCETNPNVPLKGTIANAAGGMWTTDGSGIFTPNAFTLNASYMPSGADVTTGIVTLVLESTGNGICNPVRDTMVVTITPKPTANAGINDTVCADVPGIALNGIITTATIGLWNTSGSGSFNPDANTLNATYVPSVADTADGTVILTLQTIDNGACSAAFSNKTITITPAPTVDAGFDQAVCGDADSILVSGLVTIATGGIWTSAGTGTFTHDDSLTTYYHLTPADTAAGSITLTLTSTGNGTCNPVQDQLILTITDAPIIDAGPDQTICADNPTVALSGSVTVASGAEWSTDTGTGFYAPNEVTLNTSYFGTDADTTAGSLTFVLTSTGNGTCNTVSDTMQVTINPAPIINAGPDVTVCADIANTTLNGSVANATGGSWVSSGTGTFADPNILNTVYDPSNADTTNKIVIITLTSTGNGFCNPVSDQMRLTIAPTPIVNAGSDQTVCGDKDTITINGSVVHATGAQWTTSGTGTFLADSSLSTSYIPSSGDKTLGSVYLKLTSYGNGSCIPVADSLHLIITPAPVVSAGSDFSVCADNNAVVITGSITVATGGVWQSSGTGTFTPNSTSLNSVTYVPSAADKALGLIGITLTSTGNGTCNAVTDDMKLTITPAPTVNAGPDQTICADALTVQLNGSKTVATGVSWTTSGTGGFSPTNTFTNSQYIPSAADKAAGIVNLTIKTTGNGTCNPVTDQMRITITPAPTVNAGIDQTICADAGTVTLSGSKTVATGGTWSTNGTGAFSPDPDGVSRTYTISAGDTTAHSVMFVLTTTGNGLCQAVKDTLMVTINPVPIVSTGSGSICSDVTGVGLDGSVVNATGGIWTTSGSGAFAPNAATLNAQYTPSQSDITAGFVVLTLTSEGHGTCNPVTAQMNVTITPLPVANAGIDQRICRFDSTVLIGQAFPNVSYGWSTTSGVNISTSGIAFVRADSDTSFVLTATDTKGCSVNDTMTVFVVDPPTFNLNPTYCYAFGTPLDANPTPMPVNGGFQWYRNDSLQLGENSTSIMIKVVGEHVISYNYGSCTVFDTTQVTPLPVLNGLDKFACTSAATILSTSNIAGASYTWTDEGGIDLGVNNDSLSVIISSTPWDSIRYIATVTDILGCVNNDTIYSVAVPPPVLTLTDQPSCVGDTALLNAEPSNIPEIAYGMYSNYAWRSNTNPLSDTGSTIKVTTTAAYSVIYNIGECFAYDTSTVTFFPLPVPSNGDLVLYCDESELTTNLDAGPGTKYFWINTPNTPNDTLQIAEVDDPGMYYVQIYNAFNCFVTDSIYAEDACPPRVFVPQAFIPNDPNPKNHTFIVQGAYFTNFKLTIYNRWGEVIYYTEDPLNGWDGFYLDQEMPIGVYPYIITYEGSSEIYKGPYKEEGSVTLIR